jgi:hypothetical protein
LTLGQDTPMIDLRARTRPPEADMTRTATDGQIRFITSLCDQKCIDLDSWNGVELDPETFPFHLVTPVLDYLKSLPSPAKAAKEELTDGMYQLASGEIYRLQYAVHGSGRLYGKRLLTETDEYGKTDIWFERDTSALRRLTLADKMSAEAAKAFGQLYGVCCVCARTLTDETSIAEGIGPICSSKF